MEYEEKQDLRKTSHSELCVIWGLIVRLKKSGYLQKEIAVITELKQRRVSEILKMHRETGKIPKPKNRGRKFGEKRLLTLEQEKEIKKIILDKNPNQLKFECFLWNAKTIKELIKQRYGIELGKQTVRDYLERWGFSMQCPQKRAYYQKESEVEAFKTAIFPEIKKLSIKENAEIYFGDETGVNNQAYNPKGYAPKNHPPIVRFQTSRVTVNMLSAVSPNGEHKFMLYEDSTTQQKLIEFMSKLVKEKKKDKVFLILDNLKVHHGKLVRQYLIDNVDKITVFYFPSYSPEINPDEYLNNILKNNLHNGLTPNNIKEIYARMIYFLTNLTMEQIKKLFFHPQLAYLNFADF